MDGGVFKSRGRIGRNIKPLKVSRLEGLLHLICI